VWKQIEVNLRYSPLTFQRLQDQDRRNHEAYIRSGEIFEDRQQAYEKMTKGYEKLLSNCQRSVRRAGCWSTPLNIFVFYYSLSELLYLRMPNLPSASHKSESIMIGSNAGKGLGEDGELILSTAGGKWEDEEERRFFEDIQDLRDYVPKAMLGLEDGEDRTSPGGGEKGPEEDLKVDMKKLDEELASLENNATNGVTEEAGTNGDVSDDEDK
jgi:regulator of nonsense transcripts 2